MSWGNRTSNLNTVILDAPLDKLQPPCPYFASFLFLPHLSFFIFSLCFHPASSLIYPLRLSVLVKGWSHHSRQPIQTAHLVFDWQPSWHRPGWHVKENSHLPALWWVTLWTGKNKSKSTELCKPITWMGEEGVQIGNRNKQGSSRTFLKS